MRCEVTFRNTRPREEVRTRTETLFAKLERFLDPASEASVVIAREHGVFTTEIAVSAHGEAHQISDTDEELRVALDRAFHRLETALRRSKEKRIDRWHDGVEPRDGFEASDAS